MSHVQVEAPRELFGDEAMDTAAEATHTRASAHDDLPPSHDRGSVPSTDGVDKFLSNYSSQLALKPSEKDAHAAAILEQLVSTPLNSHDVLIFCRS
jgi:hypothetical protein